MIHIDILVISILILVFIELFFLKLDYVSPTFIFTASFGVCSFCTAYMSHTWTEIEFINIETYTIIVVSISLFLCIELIIKFYSLFITRNKYQNKLKELEYVITIDNSILNFTIFLGIICVVWSLLIISRYITDTDWNSIMAIYKNDINTNASAFGIDKKILNQLMKVMTALSYVLLFVYTNNSSKIKIKKETRYKYFAIFALYLMFKLLLTGGRQGVLFFVVAWFTMHYLCKTNNSQKKDVRKERRGFIRKFSVATAIIFPMFYFLGRFVGRKESEHVLDAALAYLTTGIYGLQAEVSNCYQSQYWGEISFPNLYSLMKLINIYPASLEEQSFLPFFRHGNTVSLLGRWYWDFKEAGVYFIVSLWAILFSSIYYFMIKDKKISHKRNFSIILYCYLIHILYFAGYDDFSINIISQTFVLIMLIMIFVYYYLVCKQTRILWGKRPRG